MKTGKRKKAQNYWKHKCDVLWGQIIREAAGNCCEICNGSPVNAHHLIGRRALFFRHNLNNGLALCVTCHLYGVNSAHENPEWLRQWVREHKPDQYAWWEKNAKAVVTGLKIDFEQVYNTLAEAMKGH